MTYLSLARLGARLFFITAILAALGMTIMAGQAHAANAPTPTTDNGGLIRRKKQQVGDTPSAASVAVQNENLLIDYTQQIAADESNPERSIYGFVDEVDAFDTVVRQSADGYGISMIEGEMGSGRDAFFRQYVRFNNPAVYRLNFEELRNLQAKNDVEMAAKLESALNWLRKQARQNPGQRTILYITDASQLKPGNEIMPLDVLIKHHAIDPKARGFETVIKSTPGTFTEQEIFKKFPEIKNSLLTYKLERQGFQNRWDYLIGNYDRLVQATGVEFTDDALENLARIATRERPNPLTEVWYLAVDAANTAKGAGAGGPDDEKRLRSLRLTEIPRLENQVKYHQRQGHTEPLRKAEKALADAKVELASLLTKSSPEARVQELTLRLDAAEKNLLEAEDELNEFNRQHKAGMFSKEDPQVVKERRRLEGDSEGLKLKVQARTKELGEAKQDALAAAKKLNRAPGEKVVVDYDTATKAASKRYRKEILVGSLERGLRNWGRMQKNIFGQDAALEAIEAQLVRRAAKVDGPELKDQKTADAIKAGLVDDSVRAIAINGLVGPTSSGKTETAKQLAETLGLPHFLFNMGEYTEAHTVSVMFGAPPGYLGHGTPGLLTGKVLEVPDCVVTLDEIEKAAPAFEDIILGIMDNGTAFDKSTGITVKFNKIVFNITSNIGQEFADMNAFQLLEAYAKYTGMDMDTKKIEADLKKKKLTGDALAEALGKAVTAKFTETEDGQKAFARMHHPVRTGEFSIDRLRGETWRAAVINAEYMGMKHRRAPFRPEFIQRITNISVYNRVSAAQSLKIFTKDVETLRNRLHMTRGIEIHLTPEAFTAMTDRFDKKGGGRSSRRILDEMAGTAGSRTILRRAYKSGEHLVLDIDAKTGVAGVTRLNSDEFDKMMIASAGDRAVEAGKVQLDTVAGVDENGKPRPHLEGDLVRNLKEPQTILDRHFMKLFRLRK